LATSRLPVIRSATRVSQLRSFTMYQAAERFLNGRLALPDVARGSDAIWTGDEIAGLTGTPCAELEAPGRWASVVNFKKVARFQRDMPCRSDMSPACLRFGGFFFFVSCSLGKCTIFVGTCSQRRASHRAETCTLSSPRTLKQKPFCARRMSVSRRFAMRWTHCVHR
jgi:hypothetical protein